MDNQLLKDRDDCYDSLDDAQEIRLESVIVVVDDVALLISC